MVTIRSFIDRVKAERSVTHPGEIVTSWDQILGEAGYHRADLNNAMYWKEVHIWCVEEFGQGNYAWAGNIFWFETKQAATWFTLRWS